MLYLQCHLLISGTRFTVSRVISSSLSLLSVNIFAVVDPFFFVVVWDAAGCWVDVADGGFRGKKSGK